MDPINGETQAANPSGEEVLDPINEEQAEETSRLYAGKYKTPEEIEQGYIESNKEATRMAQEIKRLTRILQTNQAERTPANSVTPNTAKTNFEGFFEKDTEAALKWLVQNHITDFATSQKSQTTYVGQVSAIWEQTKKEYPDLNNPESELFKLADKLLFERGLAERHENGDIALVTPYAYRIAVEAASAILSREVPAKQAVSMKKNQAISVSGRATGFIPQGRLSPEAYNKLSEDDKDKYDQWSINQKGR